MRPVRRSSERRRKRHVGSAQPDVASLNRATLAVKFRLGRVPPPLAHLREARCTGVGIKASACENGGGGDGFAVRPFGLATLAACFVSID